MAQVAKESRPYSLFSAIDIFRAFSAILLSVDYPDISLLGSDSAETIGIELGVRVGSKLEQWTVPFYNNGSQRVPQLRDIPELSFRVRLAFFNDVLKIDETSVGKTDLFPDNFKLFICSVIFWFQVSSPTLKQFQSLVLMSLMFEAILCKTGWVRSEKKNRMAKRKIEIRKFK